ncbi:MAG: hypothetical protein ACK55I_27805, partial [bacterium]
MAMERFQFAAHVALGLQAVVGGGGSGRVRSDIGQPVEGRLRVASADGEVHGTVVRVYHHIGHRQRLSAEELLGLADIGTALRLEVHGPQLAEAPVADEEGLLVLG